MKYVRTTGGIFEYSKLGEAEKSNMVETIKNDHYRDIEYAGDMADLREAEEEQKRDLDSIQVKIETEKELLVIVESSNYETEDNYGTIISQADTIEDLIMVGDLVVWYNASSKRDEYFYIHDKDELFVAKHYPIKQVFTQTNVGREFKLVITANDKGELELL